MQAANGIIFNSLTEGNGTLTLGTDGRKRHGDFSTARPIAVGGETATINLNGYVTTLTGQLVSLGTDGVGHRQRHRRVRPDHRRQFRATRAS